MSEQRLHVPKDLVIPQALKSRLAELEPASKAEGGRTLNAWFALSENRPLPISPAFWIADWECVRKVGKGLIRCDLSAS